MGGSCEHKCPRNTKDGKVCSNRGTCQISEEGAFAVCDCNPGSVGDTCDAGCPIGQNTLPCSGHGQCMLEANAGECKCEEGWDNGLRAPCLHRHQCRVQQGDRAVRVP